ncbi:MAG: hypothetical protein AB1679_11635 [Actinomycetota bacterium]
MIGRLVRNRAVQFGAVLALVIAGRFLPEVEPRTRAALPSHDAFFAPASVNGAGDPLLVAVRILRAHTRFPAVGPDAAAAEIRAMATTADGERLATSLRGDLERLHAGYPGGPTRFWVGPLGARSSNEGPGRARVDLWFSRVVAPPRLPLYEEWRVAKMQLVREAGAWRLADYQDVPGPRPGAHPAQSAEPADVDAVSPFEAIPG